MIGMRKEYIMTEEDKVLKRHKIEQNRAKKRPPSGESRVAKMKRETVEDCSYDNDTSVSVASVKSAASTISSDGYSWESEKKYADLNRSGQSAAERLSPATAASVPSPSSPPENREIVGSKTLEMLGDSTPNPAWGLERRGRKILQVKMSSIKAASQLTWKSSQFIEFNWWSIV